MNLSDLWRTDGTYVEAFCFGMNRIGFQFIMRCVRFDNISTREERVQIDKLAQIRILFAKFNSNQKKCYFHSAHVTFDKKYLEAIVALDNIYQTSQISMAYNLGYLWCFKAAT